MNLNYTILQHYPCRLTEKFINYIFYDKYVIVEVRLLRVSPAQLKMLYENEMIPGPHSKCKENRNQFAERIQASLDI